MSKPTVIFVDDDRFYAMHWIERLRDRFEVEHYVDAGDAKKAILKSRQISCLILDVMMPTPSSVPEDVTMGGLETGIWLLHEIADWITENSIPAIIMTNRELDLVQSAVDMINLPPGLVEVRQKLNTNRSRLLELVCDKVARWGRP